MNTTRRFKFTFLILCFLTLLANAKPKEVLAYVEKTNHIDKTREYIFYYYIKDKYINRIEYFKDTTISGVKLRFFYKKEVFKYDNKNRLINKQIWFNEPNLIVENRKVFIDRKAKFNCVFEEKYTYEQPINF